MAEPGTGAVEVTETHCTHNQPRSKKQSITPKTRPSSCLTSPISTASTTTPSASPKSIRSSVTESMVVPSVLVAPSLSDFDDFDEEVAANSSDNAINLGHILAGLDTECMDVDTVALLADLLATSTATTDLIPTLPVTANTSTDSIMSASTLPLFPSSLVSINNETVKSEYQEMTLDSIVSGRKSRWRARSRVFDSPKRIGYRPYNASTTRLAASDFLGASSPVWKRLVENDSLRDLEREFYESLIDHGWRGGNSQNVGKHAVGSWVVTNENWVAKEKRTSVIVDILSSERSENQVEVKMEDYVTLNNTNSVGFGKDTTAEADVAVPTTLVIDEIGRMHGPSSPAQSSTSSDNAMEATLPAA